MVAGITLSLPLLWILAWILLSGFGGLDIFQSPNLPAIIHGSLNTLPAITSFAAALRNRANTRVLSAWLFFFLSRLIFILGGTFRAELAGDHAWISELTFALALVPVILFSFFIGKPVKLLVGGRSYRSIIPGVLFILIAGVCIIVAVITSAKSSITWDVIIMKIIRLILDVCVALPIALMLFNFGVKPDNLSYLLIGLGFLLSVTADFIALFFAITDYPPHHSISFILTQAELLYFFLGGLVESLRRRKSEELPA